MTEEKVDATSETMKAIVCTNNGPPKEVLKIMDVPIPKIEKPSHVLIKVLYASINPIDYKMINGMMGMISPKKPPFIAGRDFSGRVVAKGTDPDLRRLEVGDLVYGQCWLKGSFAEYCLVDANNVRKMPNVIDPLQAAAVPLVTQTSYQSISKLKLTKQSKLLILGGSTATGLTGIQIAKRFCECKEVIVTSSQEELCTLMGADRVINYKKEDWVKVLKDYNLDAIYDCVGGLKSWNDCRSGGVLKKNGSFVTIVGDTAHGDNFTVSKLFGTAASIVNRKFWGAVGNQYYDLLVADSTKNLREISSLINENKLKVVLDPESPFKFEEYMRLVDKCMAHKARGKLILKISGDEKEEMKDDKVEEKGDEMEEAHDQKSVLETKEYVYKSIDKDNNTITCLDSDFNDITFDLDPQNTDLLEKISKVIEDGKNQKKDVNIIVCSLKRDKVIQTVSDAKIVKA